MGFILSGAGIGGLVLAPSIRALLTAIGPRWTLRFMAFLNLVVSLPIAITASPSRFVGKRKTHLDLKLALKPLFIFSVSGAFLQAGGNGLPLTFISDYSVVVGFSSSFGATLLAVNNGVNSISRVVTGWAGDKFGRQNTLILTVLWCVLAVVGLWLGSAGKGGDRSMWLAFVVVYGFASGGYNALFPTVSYDFVLSHNRFPEYLISSDFDHPSQTVAEVFGIQAYSSVIGFLYFVRGCGAMFGSPVGGQILGESVIGNYFNVIWYDFALFAGATICVMGVRACDALGKRAWVWKA